MTKVIFPGSFDPIHLGHLDIVHRAANLFDEVVVAVYNRPLKSLLFTPKERIALVKATTKGLENVTVVGYDDLTVHFARKIGASAIVRGLRVFSDFEYEFRMAMANKRLDSAVETIAFVTDEQNTFLSSSTVKEIAALGGDVSTMVPEIVLRALQKKFRPEGSMEA
ncbi:MAG TPA: pantetheine-phosphate adenylyltransferase [Anaerolineaceae bacterium]|nr:pantetheine-phosphate adenylyltransferase [Anaerolineaceae bacterium]